MPRVSILRQTVACRQTVRPGQVLDLPDAEARLLIAAGMAALWVPVPPPQPSVAKRAPTKTPLFREAQP